MLRRLDLGCVPIRSSDGLSSDHGIRLHQYVRNAKYGLDGDFGKETLDASLAILSAQPLPKP